MPTASLRFCLQPGCRQLVTRGRCRTHRKSYSGADLYDLALWRHPVYGLRARVLREQPFCAGPGCTRALVEGDAEVDHIRPHYGDRRLFFLRTNLQGLCSACHAAKTRGGW